jgi:hypothetical protein
VLHRNNRTFRFCSPKGRDREREKFSLRAQSKHVDLISPEIFAANLFHVKLGHMFLFLDHGPRTMISLYGDYKIKAILNTFLAVAEAILFCVRGLKLKLSGEVIFGTAVIYSRLYMNTKFI